MPSTDLIAAMGEYSQALLEGGDLLSGDGLKPSSDGKRVVFGGDPRTLLNRPFATAVGLVAGFWL